MFTCAKILKANITLDCIFGKHFFETDQPAIDKFSSVIQCENIVYAMGKYQDFWHLTNLVPRIYGVGISLDIIFRVSQKKCPL
jgi:hypothetical protein